eukprot:TRINITY_DN97390_c0_g1_i1.p1 TRINITY_DN97390_c0_g1~~TRINITY_DN97390_c0_g1_i1.p1  ORF type:complete len:416 (-),score=94.64 TRINITY_DN97390_c0_g1_i1:71-1318(-)
MWQQAMAPLFPTWRSLASLLLLVCNQLTPGEFSDEELAARQYFGLPEAPEVQSVRRVSNLTAQEFYELALDGIPFVIEDGGLGQPFVGWTCDTFKEKYPNGVVKVEYVGGADAGWPITKDWQSHLKPIPGVDAGGPEFAPWYWGVKGADEPEEASMIFRGGRNPLPDVQRSMRLPEFMSNGPENQHEVLGSPEFWFSMPKAGAAMHMDSHCESTLAIQLSGTRKWRIGWAPSVPNGTFFKDGTYADRAIYGKGYRPPLEAVVSEGEAFYMPSAFLHETINVGDSCAASLTFQFKDPIPARYMRHFLRDLRRTGDFNECWGLLKAVASPGKSSDASLKKLDKDGDGLFSVGEAGSSNLLRATHAFHDEDRNGFVTASELSSGIDAWKKADKEAKSKLKKTVPKSFHYLYRKGHSEL